MKRLLLTLLILSVAFTACKDKPEPEPEIPSEIKIDVTSIVIPTEGASEVVRFNASHDWTVTVEPASWCTVSPSSGKAGDASITVSAQSNGSPDDLSATVTIKSNKAIKAISVTQKQKDALTVTASKFDVGSEGGEVSIEVKANIEFNYSVSDSAKTWITYLQTKALRTSNLVFGIQPNTSDKPREGIITITSGDIKEDIKVVQKEDSVAVLNTKIAQEREYLMEFFKSTGGESWTNNTNWGSELPVSQWYGIMVDKSGRIIDITLQDNNLTGSIPAGLSKLENLTGFDIYRNKVTGEIPKELGDLKNLYLIYLNDNNFTGTIPKELGSLSNLEYIALSANELEGEIPAELGNLAKLKNLSLFKNQLTGSLPASLGNLSKLEYMYLYGNLLEGSIPSQFGNLESLLVMDIRGNKLSGKVPESVMAMPCWATNWHTIVDQVGHGIPYDGIDIYIPEFSVKTLTGEILTNDVVTKNKLTVLYFFLDWCPFAETFTPRMVATYEMFKDLGLGVFSPTTQSSDITQAYVSKHKIPWPCTEDQSGTKTFVNYTLLTPTVAVFDQKGYMVFSSSLSDYDGLIDFLTEKLGTPNGMDAEYESTDYSKDGTVATLQEASSGNGIDVVLIGDGYTDRLIADGTYDKIMKLAMDKFFETEPVKSYKELFNVYSVTAVSKNEVYAQGNETALGGYFGGSMHVGGTDSKVMEYAKKAISDERMNDAVVVVMMNSTAFAGTCYMYTPVHNPSIDNYGNGLTISYFPVGVNEEALAQLIKHEAVGHGLAKLADEYAYKENGTITALAVGEFKDRVQYGWYKNVDLTNDPAQIKWSAFLSDPRYEDQGLGVFEGAYTFWKGVYRPSQDGAMNSGVGPFNAPSREAIYYRIHKLANGAGWEYNYEDFVTYDAKNRSAVSSSSYVLAPVELPGPPVVKSVSWGEAYR